MLGDVEVQKFAATVRDDEPYIEQLEANCGYDQEVHCGDHVSMVSKEGHPSLPLIFASSSLGEVAGDGCQAHGESQLLELGQDSPSTPGVLAGEAPDQILKFWGDPGPAWSALRDGSPVAPKSRPMPSDHRLGLDDDETGLPSGPELEKGNPKRTIERSELWSRVLAGIGRELLTKGKFDDRLLALTA
jgi:hypothetical protein